MGARMGGQVHFRCAFDAKCVNEDWTDPYGDLIKRVRGWSEKVLGLPANTLKGKKFTHGSNFRDVCPPRSTLETLFRNYNDEGMPPTYWGCRLTHQCREFSHRRWTNDLTITCRSPREFRIVLVNSHAITDYLGEEPAPPNPSAPGIVQSLVTSKHWRCTSGTELLNGKAVVAYSGRMDLVRKALSDDRRGCPIVYVSCAQETGKPLIDVDRLANLLSGTAVVYVAESPEVDKEAEHRIGNIFGTWNGGIRIYQPRVNFQSPYDARRHRFFTGPRVLELGMDEVALQIVRACCRRAPVIVADDVASIDDIVSVARRKRLRELASRNSSTDNAELEELIAAVDEDNLKLRNELEETRMFQELAIEEKTNSLAQVQYEYEQYKQSTRTTYSRIRDVERQLGALENLKSLPENLEDTLRMVCALHSSKLEFLEDAAESAREAHFNNVAIAWKLLWSLAEDLHPMLLNGSTPFSDTEYKNRSGFNLAMSEGSQTQRDSKLMKLRQRTYRGKDIDITPHVGWGTGNDCLRVHFAIDRESQKLIIGHCGNHLDNWTTKKRK